MTAPGVWSAAWQRFRQDRVGIVSLATVLAFALLMGLAALGLVASQWQAETGVPNAPPTFIGPAAPEAQGPLAAAGDALLDLSDVDPLAPRYREWAERAAQLASAERPKAATLPLGGDRLGRDVLAKTIKGAEISVFVGVFAALLAALIGTVLGACAGFFAGSPRTSSSASPFGRGGGVNMPSYQKILTAGIVPRAGKSKRMMDFFGYVKSLLPSCFRHSTLVGAPSISAMFGAPRM